MVTQLQLIQHHNHISLIIFFLIIRLWEMTTISFEKAAWNAVPRQREVTYNLFWQDADQYLPGTYDWDD
jgi:hypothetical protein